MKKLLKNVSSMSPDLQSCILSINIASMQGHPNVAVLY